MSRPPTPSRPRPGALRRAVRTTIAAIIFLAAGFILTASAAWWQAWRQQAKHLNDFGGGHLALWRSDQGVPQDSSSAEASHRITIDLLPSGARLAQVTQWHLGDFRDLFDLTIPSWVHLPSDPHERSHTLGFGWPWVATSQYRYFSERAWRPELGPHVELQVPGYQTKANFPIQPYWPGLLADTAFFATLLALPVYTLRALRRTYRRRRHRCIHCNYDLAGVTAPACPECNHPRPSRHPANDLRAA